MAPRRSNKDKGKQSAKQRGGDPDAPSVEQWKRMQAFQRFIVRDRQGEKYSFSVGNVATVLPDSIGPRDFLSPFEWWLVKIVDIRKDESEENAWAQVHWFYSGQDTADVCKSFDPSCSQKYERLISTHTDLVSSDCFEDVVHMNYYDESAIDQNLIPVDEWYCRFRFDQSELLVTTNPLTYQTPIKVGVNTCVCSEPYDPLDGSVIMHFCPRPRCRRAYHRSCLIKGKYFNDSEERYDWLLLYTSPFTDDEDFNPCPRPNKRRRTTNGERDQISHLKEALSEDRVSETLVAIAATPAVKGAKLSLGYLNGNIEQVCFARQLIYEYLAEGDLTALDQWDDRINIDLGIKARDRLKATSKRGKEKMKFRCPRCSSTI